MTETTPFMAPVMPDALNDPAPEPDESEQRSYTPAEGLDPEAPYGYMIDRKTGDKRPRKRAGRGTRVVKASEPAESGAPKAQREPDRVPGKVRPEDPKARRTRVKEPKPEPEPLPPFRTGPIAKGMNRLYLKAGRILAVMDADTGNAVIAMTQKFSDDDVTVGEAWEELARVNPRIRAVLLKLITGGAWGQLIMAHAPLAVAILMKERVRRRLPFMSLLSAMVGEPGQDPVTGPFEPGPDMAGMFAGLTQEDIMQAAAFASQMMPGVVPPEARQTGRWTGTEWIPGDGRSPMPSRAAVAEDLLGEPDAPA